MADMFDKATRSRIMAAVRTSFTAPERLLSDLLRGARLHPRRQAKELPGTPATPISFTSQWANWVSSGNPYWPMLARM
jgi:G:T-mismatch repair DNA endonuclease (very short patch repair protein)